MKLYTYRYETRGISTGIGHMEFINRRIRIGIEDYIEDLNG